MKFTVFLQKHKVLITAALSVILTVCVLITVWAIWLRNDDTSTLIPDYPTQGIDENQKPIAGDNTQKIPSTSGGAINVSYKKDAQISLSDGKISMYYANPNASNQNVVVMVMIDNVVLAKSGLITPGNMISELWLNDSVKDMLSVGGYDATLVICAYHPTTNEKAMLDTRADLKIEVRE